MTRPAAFFVRAIVGAMVTLTHLGACASAPPSASNRALGTTVRFELPSNDGVLVPLPQPNAKVTVVDAFAPTCEPCATKVPALLDKKNELSESGAKLVLVAVLADGESDRDAVDALARWGATSPFLVDRGNVLQREVAIDALPGTVILDASGEVRWVAPAGATADDILAAARAAARH